MISYIEVAWIAGICCIAGTFFGAVIAIVTIGLCKAAGDADKRLGYK